MVPQREAKDPGGLQYCLTRIFRWGTVLAPPSPFGIAVLAYSLSEPQVSPRKGPTSVSWPYPSLSPESPGRPQGDGCRQARLSSHLRPALPLGAGMMSFLPPTPPVYLSWEPRAPTPPQPFPTLAGACESEPVTSPSPWQHRKSGSVALCSPLECGLAGERVWVSHGTTSSTSKGEDRE